jgi:tetratricopeptide (TPR) repeat protein/O-antigen ligase
VQSKLGLICDRIIEAGWLAAAVFTPLYFNVYSSRVFEPDKISMLRNIVLMMTVAWFVKLIEGVLANRSASKRGTAALEHAAPGWLPALWRVPMILPIALYAFIYLFSTVVSVVPLTSFFGSYQRMQGLITQYTYIALALLILANMRSRVQLERLITFAIVTSIPVAGYGLMQAAGADPLPWAGDVQTRVASTLGNAIFVAAYLIMMVPLTLQRWMAALAARRAGTVEQAPDEPAGDPWPLVIIGSGAVFLLIFIQYTGMITGNSIDALQQAPNLALDVLMWGLVLAGALALAWAANSVVSQITPAGRRPVESDPGVPPFVMLIAPLLQILVLLGAVYIVGTRQTPDFSQWIVLPGAIFIFYALTYLYSMPKQSRQLMNTLQVVGLPVLMVVQVLVIFLTQSRGPELGLLLGLVVFGFAFLLRRRMFKAFAAVLALTVLFGAFLVVFNLPDSPIASWRDIKYIGRLGLISQIDEGTGKVRTLIWGGAWNLITSDPVRMIVGWGPESMYVAYNKFYPPDLAHWELRNATPDRSHDVFFDQAVTMGLLGLVAYLFLVGAFIWYAVRALRKAPGLNDQLLLIGLLATGVAHVGELVTGIQIAATYTYFYMAVALTVVLSYVLNGYLRQETPVPATGDATETTLNGAPALEPIGAAAGNGHEEAVAAVPARGSVAVAGAAKPNGRGAVPAGKKGYAAVGPATGPAAGRRAAGGNQPSAGGRIPPAGRSAGGARPNMRAMSRVGSYALAQPGMLVLYGVLAAVGLLIAIGLNVNLVKADMFYKQGLAYDNAQRWPNAIGPYEKAIQIAPNEDFYYLFLGRAYMEWSKRTASFQGSPPAEELLARAQSALLTAEALNPLNTDHYANLGRLYIYWGDTLAQDSKTADQAAQKYAQGIAEYEKAHNLSPGNAEIWNELALAYAKGGRTDDALAAIRGSQQMDDRYDQTPFIAAEIERSAGERYEALAQQPGVTQEISATYTLSATKEAQAAAADYVATIKLTPAQLQDSDFDKRIDFLNRHNVLPVLAAGYQEVISAAVKAKQEDPANPDEPVQARAALGYIQWKLNKTADAIAEFERAVQLQCDDFFNLQNLGMLYRDTGQDEKALNMLEAALAVADCNPNDPYAKSCDLLRASTDPNANPAKTTVCTPLTGQSDMTDTINSLRSEVQRLKQKLGRS